MQGAKFAILPFKSASEGKTMTNRVSTDGNAIADILTIQMLYKNYHVLERDQVEQILNEINLSQIYAPVESDQQETTMKSIGKMLGVDFIIYGSVIQYEYVAPKGVWYISMGVTARIINTESGKVVFVCTATHQGHDIATTLDGISLAITDALTEEKVYVWQ
jgi:curli biogenesis system outer membrane secretion channel CsgG